MFIILCNISKSWAFIIIMLMNVCFAIWFRCQGLTEINKLLREQLETATEVNQTLTSDVHRLTKEWQQARSELLVKESEWKEEEQVLYNLDFIRIIFQTLN